MALVFCDNFENWASESNQNPGPWLSADGLSGGAGKINIATVVGILGEYTPGISGTSGYIAVGYSSIETVIINCRVAFATANFDTGNKRFISFLDAGTVQSGLTYMNNGYLHYGLGSSGTAIASSTNFFSINNSTYRDIELKVRIHNTLGSAELRVNGQVEFSVSGVNTRSTSNNSSNVIRIGSLTSNALMSPNFQHTIVMDTTGSVMNDFIGPVDVSSLRPSADGNYTTWVANTGDRWDAVNDAITDSDSTYVHADGAAEKVSFAMTDLPAGVTDIYGVMGQAQVKREADTTRITRMFVRAGGTDQAIGSTVGVGPTYAFRNALATLNPHTGVAWTPAEINALELGMEITT